MHACILCVCMYVFQSTIPEHRTHAGHECTAIQTLTCETEHTQMTQRPHAAAAHRDTRDTHDTAAAARSALGQGPSTPAPHEQRGHGRPHDHLPEILGPRAPHSGGAVQGSAYHAGAALRPHRATRRRRPAAVVAAAAPPAASSAPPTPSAALHRAPTSRCRHCRLLGSRLRPCCAPSFRSRDARLCLRASRDPSVWMRRRRSGPGKRERTCLLACAAPTVAAIAVQVSRTCWPRPSMSPPLPLSRTPCCSTLSSSNPVNKKKN